MKAPILPIAECEADGLPFAPDGAPAVPVRSPLERSVVEAITAVSGGSIQVVDGRGAARAPTPAELVVGLGEDTRAEAMLYGHLTGRRVRCATSQRELAALAPDVVVVPLERLSLDVLDALFLAREHVGAPGVMGARARELRRQVLLRASAARVRGALGERRIDIDPAAPGAIQRDGDCLALGAGASTAELLTAMAASAGVLSLTTHSDGIDARLGRDLVMCSLTAPSTGALASRSPHCANSGQCHRLNLPIAEAIARGAIIAPDRISCRLLLLTICYGIKDPSDPSDPDWNLVTRFLRVPTIGALMIPPSLYFGPAPPVLASQLAAGASTGEAVACSNAEPRERRLRQYHILFGDPAFRLPAAAATGETVPVRPSLPVQPEVPSTREAPASPIEHLTAAEYGHIELHRRLCLDALPDLDPHGPVPDRFTHGVPGHGLEAVLRLSGSLDADERTSAVAEFLAAREALLTSGGVPTTRWLGYAAARDVRIGPCPQCGISARRYRFELPIAGPAMRRVVVCPRCSFAEDAPEFSTLVMQWRDGLVELTGALPVSPWRATLRFWAQTTHNGINVPWPAAPDGSPVRKLRPRVELAPGVWSASFALVHSFEYTVLSTRFSVGSRIGSGADDLREPRDHA